MRRAGLIALSAVCLWHQAPITAADPVPAPEPRPLMSAPVPPGPVPDAAVEAVLSRWEKRLDGITNFRAEVSLKREDGVFRKKSSLSGSVLLARPNNAIVRLDNDSDPTKTDYEAYIFNGQSVFMYSGLQKSVTEVALPPKGVIALLWPDTFPVLDLLAGMKAADALVRFEVSIFKTDDNYIYLDLKPRTKKDKREFALLRLALYGPGEGTAKHAYLPAQVYVVRPNGDSEMWKFTNPKVNLPNIESKAFQFVEPPKGWTVNKAKAP